MDTTLLQHPRACLVEQRKENMLQSIKAGSIAIRNPPKKIDKLSKEKGAACVFL